MKTKSTTVNYSARKRKKSLLLEAINNHNKKIKWDDPKKMFVIKQKPRILLLIEGGFVQGVSTTEECEFLIYDYDNVKIGENPLTIQSQDSIFKPGEAHTIICAMNPREQEAKDELKRIKF